MSNGAFEDGFSVKANTTNGEEWREYRRLILSELKRLAHEQELQSAKHEAQIAALRGMFVDKFDRMGEQVSDLRTTIKVNERERKILATMFGFLGGFVPGLLALIYFLIQRSAG